MFASRINKLIFIMGAMMMLPVTLIFGSPKTVTLKDQQYYCIRELANLFGMTFSKTYDSASISSKFIRLSFSLNKKTGSINGININYLFPPVNNKDTVLISLKDYQYILLPILNAKSLKMQRVKTIVIDPGHGGKDNGAQGIYSKEKDIALTVSRRVAALLTQKGYKVVMTRNRDIFLSLEERPETIGKFNGDIFVSIHCNSAADKTVSGHEVFVLAPHGTSSTYSKSIVNTFEKGNYWNNNNFRLGFEIQKALSSTGANDRGLKHARFKVLRLATKPAALIEIGFLSNRAEESQLKSKAYQEKLAQAIVAGITAYCNVAAKGS